MRFLADEGLDHAIVRALRSAGHDVYSIRESMPSVPDGVVAREAFQSGRILLTEDKGFGQMLAAGQRAEGVVFIRVPFAARKWMVATVVALANETPERLSGNFVTLTPGKIRFTPIGEQA